MAIPKYNEMYKEVLEALANNKLCKTKELRDIVANKMNVSADERKETLSSGGFIFSNRVNWTCAYLKQAGLIKSTSRGVYQITESGQKALKECSGIIDNNYLSKFESFNKFVSRKNIDKKSSNDKLISKEIDNTTDLGLSPQDLIDDAFRKINFDLTDELLSEIMNQSPEFFEHMVVKLLTTMGYGSSLEEYAIVTKYSCDEGIDGIIREDKLGFNNIYIQAKRWDRETSVGRPEIQKFVGALVGQGANKGLFITTAKFSKEAKEYVAKQHTAKIVLIDGKTLAKLMIDNNVGVSTESAYFIKKIDSDFFDESID